MEFLTSVDQLEALYGTVGQASLRKVAHQLTPQYRKWINASRFMVVATVGSDGTDASPRGDDGPVAHEIDPKTLAIPDWRGNNRLDTLRNLLQDDRISLMFMIPGRNEVVRVNGTARLTTDETLREQFEFKGKQPATVIVVQINEVYVHCARALIRSALWAPESIVEDVPSVGQILQEVTDGETSGAAYDADWNVRGPKTLW